MNELKVLFVGIGSIAKRHIRNLQSICKEKNISIQIDAFRRKTGSEKPDGISRTYSKIEDITEKYDALFITNPTEMHLETLISFHDKAMHFFIEKPAVSISQIKEAKNLQLKNNSVYYVACPLRYNAVIQWIKNNINPNQVISVRSISSSYLPDWRPGQDYRKTYSAHKDLGGGVSIDLTHEWDYLTYLFGWPSKVQSFIGKKSPLEIDSDDYAVYIAEFTNKVAELHLDYFGRKTLRTIDLFTTDDTIIGDIANNCIHFLKEDKTIDFKEERDDFQKRELQHFLDIIDEKKANDSNYWHSIRVLELTQGKVEQ